MLEELRAEIESLLKEGLFDSAWTLCSFLVASSKQKHPHAKQTQTGQQLEARDWTLFGDAAFGMEDFAQALGFYEKALMLLRSHGHEEKSTYPMLLRAADCNLKLKDYKAAADYLKAVPFDSRPLRHSLALARLYERWGKRKNAILAYQEVVDKTKGRLVVSAAIALARLGATSKAVAAVGGGGGGRASSHSSGSSQQGMASLGVGRRFPFLQKLVAGHGFVAKYKLGLATTAFRGLLAEFPSCLLLLVQEATLQFDLGKLDDSLQLLKKARDLYPSSLLGADTHALILRIRERQGELTRLTHDLMRISPERPEPWIVLALDYSSDHKSSPKKALEHLTRVLHVYPNHTGALLAKGFLHLRHNDGKRAAAAYQKARDCVTSSSDLGFGASTQLPRFCVFQGLVESYLQMHEIKRALGTAKEALELMPHNPKSLTLIGIVLSQSPEMREKACKAFRKALSIDPQCYDAVEALSRFYHMEKRYDKIIDLLKVQLRHRQRDYLHIRLGDAYKMSGRIEEALEHYHAALALTPDHREALKGIETLESNLRDESMIEDGDEQEDHDDV